MIEFGVLAEDLTWILSHFARDVTKFEPLGSILAGPSTNFLSGIRQVYRWNRRARDLRDVAGGTAVHSERSKSLESDPQDSQKSYKVYSDCSSKMPRWGDIIITALMPLSLCPPNTNDQRIFNLRENTLHVS